MLSSSPLSISMPMTELVGAKQGHAGATEGIAEDSVCKEVSVAVDDEEKRIVFVDHQHGEMSVRITTIIR